MKPLSEQLIDVTTLLCGKPLTNIADDFITTVRGYTCKHGEHKSYWNDVILDNSAVSIWNYVRACNIVILSFIHKLCLSS